MSSALSPTTNLIKDPIPVSTKDFGECIKYFQNAHRSLMRLNGLVNKLPHNQPLRIGNHEIRKSQINKYSQAYLSQLGDLRKMFSNRKRKVRKGPKLMILYYISDQLVEFYKNADLGVLDPSDESSDDLNKHIELVTKHRIASTGILTSLMARYIQVNKMKSSEDSGRFIPDSNMLTNFNTTSYLLPKYKNDGTFSKTLINIGEERDLTKIPKDKNEKLMTNITNGHLSAVDRVKNNIDKRSNKNVYDKDKGVLYTSVMVFNNFYRIPPSLLEEEEMNVLKTDELIEMAFVLQNKLTFITKWHNQNKTK